MAIGHHTGAVGAVLAGDFVRPSADGTGDGCPSASGGLVPQESSDLRRCARDGAQGVVGQEETFYGSPAQTDTVKVPRAFVERLTDAVC